MVDKCNGPPSPARRPAPVQSPAPACQDTKTSRPQTTVRVSIAERPKLTSPTRPERRQESASPTDSYRDQPCWDADKKSPGWLAKSFFPDISDKRRWHWPHDARTASPRKRHDFLIAPGK